MVSIRLSVSRSNRSRVTRVVLPFLAFLLCWTPAGADQLVKSGPELLVNTYTADDQGFPEVAADANGDYVVVWESYGQDGDQWGVFGQRFARSGDPVGSEFPVNSLTTDVQDCPRVSMGSTGEFVVTWDSFDSDGSDFGVRAQRFDSAGNAVGTEFQVNSTTANNQWYSTSAIDASGNFLVAWESFAQDLSLSGIYAQHYDSAGNAIGDEFQVNVTTANDQNDVRLQATDTGFIVAWESTVAGNGEEVFMRLLDSNANFTTGEIQVNTYTPNNQENPSIAVNADGTFAVVWESDGQDGSSEGIYAQVFDSSGTAIGSELLVNTYTTGNQDDPKVSTDGEGNFVAVWESLGQVDGMSDEIIGRRFDTAGQPLGGEFQVNTQTTFNQWAASLADLGQGRFVVSWLTLETSEGNVKSQHFELDFFSDGFESGDSSAWTTVP